MTCCQVHVRYPLKSIFVDEQHWAFLPAVLVLIWISLPSADGSLLLMSSATSHLSWESDQYSGNLTKNRSNLIILYLGIILATDVFSLFFITTSALFGEKQAVGIDRANNRVTFHQECKIRRNNPKLGNSGLGELVAAQAARIFTTPPIHLLPLRPWLLHQIYYTAYKVSGHFITKSSTPYSPPETVARNPMTQCVVEDEGAGARQLRTLPTLYNNPTNNPTNPTTNTSVVWPYQYY